MYQKVVNMAKEMGQKRAQVCAKIDEKWDPRKKKKKGRQME